MMRRSSQIVADISKAASEDGKSLDIYRQRKRAAGDIFSNNQECQYLHHPSYTDL